jgi:tRNA threonylcarbamoyladenosine biosynthesis protein TsaB
MIFFSITAKVIRGVHLHTIRLQMVHILHIDTSGETGTTAIATDGIIVAKRINENTRNQSAVINIHIEELLAEIGISSNELSAIAVCGGPGSYTGLRIGLATAKGLCYALDIPLLLHNKLLQLTIAQHYKHLSEYEFYGAIIVAREREYFISIHDNNLNEIVFPQHIYEDELINLINKYGGQTLFTGQLPEDGIRKKIEDKNIQMIENQIIDFQSWAAYSFQQYNCNGFVNLAEAAPFYLKDVYTHKSKSSI